MVSLTVAVSASLSLAAAVPVHDGIRSGLLEARQAPDCNIGTQINNLEIYDSSCWNALNIMPYLTNWKATTPACTDADRSAGQTSSCCVASEPWSTCFLRLATKNVGAYDCTQLLTNSCVFPIDLDPALDPTIASQVNYIVLNIAMINRFFAGYRTALENVINSGRLHMNDLLSEKVSLSMFSSNVEINAQNMMAALTLGLAFPQFSTSKLSTVSDDGTTTTYSTISKRDPQDSTSGTSPSPNTTSGASDATAMCNKSWLASYWQSGRHHRRQLSRDCPDEPPATFNLSAPVSSTLYSGSPPVVIFTQALQQSPNVASAMWPSTVNPATIPIQGVMAGLTAGSNILTAGLDLIMNDVGTFIAFAGYGIFSTPLPLSTLPSAYEFGFAGAFDTYVVSAILAQNFVSATPGSIVPTNPCSSSTSLCSSSSSYWSPVTGRQYSLKGGVNVESFLVGAMNVTELDLGVLFDGAYNCTFAGQAGGSVVSLNADKSLNLACLSVLPMYIHGDCPAGATFVNGKCPFGSTG